MDNQTYYQQHMNVGRWIVLAVILLSGCRPDVPVVRVSVVGDVLLARGVPAALAHDSATLRRTAQALWADSRCVIGNLECPLTAQAWPVAKRFMFRAEPRYAAWLRQLGFTHLSLANNHTLDQHLPGLHTTATTVQAASIGTLGYAADSLAGCLPTLLGADSSVAVFAYSALPQRLPGEGCVCGRNFTELCERLAAYKTLFPHRAVLVYLHWGVEYAAAPTAQQRQQARRLIDCGADAVVGAHPHVVQPAEFYRGRPIVYSIGNFLFDQQGQTATNLALQVDFDVRAGRVVATYLRPLQLVGAIPQPANAEARAGLAMRIKGENSTISLQEQANQARGWQLLPLEPAAPADTLPAYFPRQLTLTDTTGRPTELRLRYRPLARQYQVRARTDGGTSVLDLGFPLYYFGQGDVDNDGQPDLLVGPVKTTHFDTTVQRRLFVYRVAPDELLPRWRGSRVVYRLRYFRAVPEGGRTSVRTIEQQPDGKYCVGSYYWQGFGLMLDQFTARNLSLDAAYRLFIR